MRSRRLTAVAATAGIVALRQTRRAVVMRPGLRVLRAFLAAVALAALGVIIAPPAIADMGCGRGQPPPGAARKDVGDVYGQPATLWLTNRVVGITTNQGYGEAAIPSPSPIERTALLVDAQRDGNHQIIVDAGREAHLYAVSGCTITPVIDESGACLALARCLPGMPFLFDMGHRAGNGDGIGCDDMGAGRRLVALLPKADNGQLTVRRTEIDVNGTTATVGRTDTVTAPSENDPAWTTAHTISCGNLTIARDGLRAGN
ncbi:hypothetical protein [Mycobacterium sp.]|uniref:hypothetical protein n=1 Tax=Mycobacterium sp. TaxID=1785 RepID=UPI002C9D54F7|nr:hypothetical protein [Mycobacterium sp.]HTQ18421.1 hypothetical protein [Mycobacterium sp.]